MTSEEIVSHLTETGPVIVLTNANQLQCRWTFWVISCSVDIIEIENTANPIKVGSLLLFPPKKLPLPTNCNAGENPFPFLFFFFFFSEDKLYDIFRKCSPASSISQYILLSIPCYILLNSITFCYIFLYPGNAVQPVLYPAIHHASPPPLPTRWTWIVKYHLKHSTFLSIYTFQNIK